MRMWGCGSSGRTSCYLIARSLMKLDDGLYDDVGMLMDNLDVNVLVSYVDCCMKIFK